MTTSSNLSVDPSSTRDSARWTAVVLTLDGVIRRPSPGLCDLVGATQDELIGRTFAAAVSVDLVPGADVVAPLRLGTSRTVRYAASARLTTGRRWEGEVAASLATGVDGTRELHLHLFEGGRPPSAHVPSAPGDGAVSLAIDQMRIGIAIVGLDGHAHAVNAALCEITGYDAATLTSGLDLRELTHPDDIDEDLRLAVSLVSGDFDTYVVEKRLLRPDGTPVWVRQEVTIDQDPSSGNVQFIAQIIDITARKKVEVELAASRSSYVNLIDRMPIGIVSSDADGRIVTSNEAAASIAGRTHFPDGLRLRDVMHPDDVVRLLPIVTDHIRSGLDFHVEFRVCRPDGTERWVRNDAHPNHDDDGTFTGLTGTWLDISEIRVAETLLRQQAIEDQLTGLGNRRFLFEALERDVAAGAAGGTVPTVLFVDLDGFKAINDTHGHAYGDEVLKQVAQRLVSSSRKEDTVARVGGDEFVILLSEVSGLADAQEPAGKLIEVVSEPYLVNGLNLRLSTSIGIALFPDDANNVGDLIHAADNALYDAKRSGKNRYCAAPGSAQAAAAAMKSIVGSAA